jgi:hypothetical protein
MKTSPTATRHRLDAILHVALELFAQQSYLDRHDDLITAAEARVWKLFER